MSEEAYRDMMVGGGRASTWTGVVVEKKEDK
jgi:hypothetical protein